MASACWCGLLAFAMLSACQCGPADLYIGNGPDGGKSGGTGAGTGGSGGSSGSGGGNGAGVGGSGGSEDSGSCIAILATLRDFEDSHPDFEAFLGSQRGLVLTSLDAQHKPVHAASGPTSVTSGPANFAQWYRDVPSVNQAFEVPLPPAAAMHRPAAADASAVSRSPAGAGVAPHADAFSPVVRCASRAAALESAPGAAAHREVATRPKSRRPTGNSSPQPSPRRWVGNPRPTSCSGMPLCWGR